MHLDMCMCTYVHTTWIICFQMSVLQDDENQETTQNYGISLGHVYTYTYMYIELEYNYG